MNPFAWAYGEWWWTDETAGMAVGDDGLWPVPVAAAGVASLAGTPSGASTVSAFLKVERKLSASTAGISSVTGALSQAANLKGAPAGTSTVTAQLSLSGGVLGGAAAGAATVTADLFASFPHPFPIPYPFGWGGAAVNELAAVVRGASSASTPGSLWPGDMRAVSAGGVSQNVAVSKSGVTAFTNAWAGVSNTIDGDASTYWGGGGGAWQVTGYYMAWTFPSAVRLGRVEWDQHRPADGGADGYYAQNWTVEAYVGYWKILATGSAGAPSYTAGSDIPVETQVSATDYRVVLTTSPAWYKWVVFEAYFYTSGYYARLTVLGPQNNTAATSAGSATVTATLSAVVVSGGVTYNELRGTIAGVGTMTNTWFLTTNRPGADGTGYVQPQSKAFLSLYANVTAGFDPTDDASGHSDFVSQNYPDGNVTEFARFLGLYANVTAGFDPTDDASGKDGFVSQSYPDGNVTEFARFLGLYVNVIPGFPPYNGRLIIEPGWTPRGLPIRPPSGKHS